MNGSMNLREEQVECKEEREENSESELEEVEVPDLFAIRLHHLQ
jgi:hypothetical protein